MRSRALLPILAAGLVLLAACGRDRPDWRVHSLLGGSASYATIETPTRVEAFPLESEAVPAAEGRESVGAYPVTGPGVPVDEATARELARVFLNADTYDWLRVKKMRWTPRLGLRFVRDAEKVDLVLCLDSDQVLVFHGRTLVQCEDTDAARPELVAIAKRLFPDDAYFQGLSPTIE